MLSPLRALVVLLAAALASTAAAQDTTRAQFGPPVLRITGVVVAEGTGRPLAGARIEISTVPARMVHTDSAGRYELKDLPWGEYSVTARFFGAISETRIVRPGCSATVVDTTGRILTRGSCTSTTETLGFWLRPDAMHGRKAELGTPRPL